MASIVAGALAVFTVNIPDAVQVSACAPLTLASPHFDNEFLPSLRKGQKLTSSTLDVIAYSSRNRNGDDDDYDDDNIFSGTEEVTDTDGARPSNYLCKPFDKLDFARVYDIAALRVPASEARSLEFRLAGHLLNWPRITNVGRVDGDDLDTDIKGMLTQSIKGSKVDGADSVLSAIYGTSTQPLGQLAQRAQIVRSFRRQGSFHFPLLERISRPRMKGLQAQKTRRNHIANRSRNKPYKVELCNCDCGSEASLHHTHHGKNRWIGPSRLLLLDAKYAGKSMSEFPMAVQELLKGTADGSKRRPKREIVPCKLTLFYEYWSLKEILDGLNIMPFDIYIAGHVGFLELIRYPTPLKHLVGQVVLDKQCPPKVKTMVNKSIYTGSQFNIVPPEVLAGNRSLVTTVVENGVSFQVNLAMMYWDANLTIERRRLLSMFTHKDVVCDISAGVGALVLPAAKKVWRIFANESNVDAVKYLARNVTACRFQSKIEVYNLDDCTFLKQLHGFSKPPLLTQVIANNISRYQEEILDVLKEVFSPPLWNATLPLPMIHLYGISNSSDPEGDFLERIVCRLGYKPERVEMSRVFAVDNREWTLCATFQFPDLISVGHCKG